MKLRIRGNSIRIRLQMSEIDQLSKTGSVTEAVSFTPDQVLRYSIFSSETETAVAAHYLKNEVVIHIPKSLAADWCNGEDVSLESGQVIDQETVLKILLEKDFQCLTRRQGEGDMFPNPNEAH